MTKRVKTHRVPFTAKDMFALVANVEQYPAFVPYCTNLRVLKRFAIPRGEGITAQMLVQYKVFREQFKCDVQILPEDQEIRVRYIEGAFRKLDNLWRFRDLEDGHSEVYFEVDFEFRNFVLQSVATAVFEKAFKYMSDAFVERAHVVYGRSKASIPTARNA